MLLTAYINANIHTINIHANYVDLARTTIVMDYVRPFTTPQISFWERTLTIKQEETLVGKGF